MLDGFELFQAILGFDGHCGLCFVWSWSRFYGEHDKASGKPFCGDTINLEIVIELNRVAGHIAFEEPEITVTGTIDWEVVEDDDELVAV